MYKATRNSMGVVDAINRISDGATVDRTNTSSPITQQFNTWLEQNPGFLSTASVSAATLTEMRILKKVQLKEAATAAISEGFTSNALGATYSYEGKRNDQLNIEAAATTTLLAKTTSNLTCTNASGVKALRSHTQGQAQVVLKDLGICRETVNAKYRTLAAQVDAATTPAQINAIAWS